MSEPLVKICGISTPEALDAALHAGADLIGLVRFPKSPRHVSLEQGRMLSERASGRALRVALVVDADDAELAAVMEALDPDLVQLHGSESPERAAEIRERFGHPVIKALGIAHAGDLAEIARYSGAGRVLLDAKPPRADSALPGGNGVAFDWSLLAGVDPGVRFMLSGGLNPGSVAQAIAVTGARAVDVSSGVERRPGEKDPAKIEAFVRAARAAFASAPRAKDQVR
jgi:phosphoribosylanthranilate isomerase